MDQTMAEVIGLATEKVNLGRQLMGNLKDLLKINGVQRIHKAIGQEVNNLLIAINEGTISIRVINASKLLHLECLVKILLKCRALTSVDHELPAGDDPMRINILCDNGACSVNVEAKNLHTLCNSLNAQIGTQRILNQAEEFVEAATSNPEVPKPPQVCLIFDNESDTGPKNVADDSLMQDFVNSIVRMEFQSNNVNSTELAITGDTKTRDQQQYKRIQMQQPRRASPVIRSAENDRKRSRKSEKDEEDDTEPPRKCERRLDTMATGNVEGVYELVREEDERETVILEDVSYEVEEEDVDEEGEEEEEEEEEDQEEQESEITYLQAETPNFFCDLCKETGTAYEQEILRLREELKRKDSIISTLRNIIGQNNLKVDNLG